MSQKAARGTKRTCQSCSARFYDLENTPIICPMCGAEFKLTTADVPEIEDEPDEVDTPVAAAAVPTDEPDTDDDDEADELADIDTDDVDVDGDTDENDNTFIEDDDDPNASVSAIVPTKSDDEDG
ncbi:MAG: TIGR02300 family protein [Pseudomonadota bacterium]